MATIFKMVFGEKLMGSPLEDFPVRRGEREREKAEIQIEHYISLYPFLCMSFRFFFYLQLVEGQSLPPPERLKHKILIKDKKVRRGANTSMTNLTGTLQRGTHLPSVPEEMEGMANEGTSKDTKVRFNWLLHI